MSLFEGVIPPVVTPLTEARDIDFDSFTRVIERLLQGGVHGLFVLGSTSEVVFYDADVRKRIVEHAVRVAGGRVPVLVGTIDPTTDRVINQARAVEELGADAIVLTAPFYTRTSQGEIRDHFRYVRDAVELPLVAYDIPICVGNKLTRETIVELVTDGTIVGLKDSSADDGNLRYVLSDLADHDGFFGMTGSETLVDTALGFGAHGVVPGLANVDPEGYVRLWNLMRERRYEDARKEQERLCRLFEIVLAGLPRVSAGSAGLGAFKTALKLLGVIDSNAVARPQRPLDENEAAKIREILVRTEVMN